MKKDFSKSVSTGSLFFLISLLAWMLTYWGGSVYVFFAIIALIIGALITKKEVIAIIAIMTTLGWGVFGTNPLNISSWLQGGLDELSYTFKSTTEKSLGQNLDGAKTHIDGINLFVDSLPYPLIIGSDLNEPIIINPSTLEAHTLVEGAGRPLRSAIYSGGNLYATEFRMPSREEVGLAKFTNLEGGGKELFYQDYDFNLHHWGDEYDGYIYMPGRKFFDLPNSSSEKFEGFPYGECKGKKMPNEVIYKLDADTGEVVQEYDLLGPIGDYKKDDDFKKFMSNCRDPLHLNDVRIIKTKKHASYFPNGEVGDMVISLRSPNVIILIDHSTGKVKWHLFGDFTQQHSPRLTDHGTMLIFDNHGSLPKNGRTRIVEITPDNKEVVGTYEASGDFFFDSEARGRIQLIDDRLFIQDHGSSTGTGSLFELICPEKYLSQDCQPSVLLTTKKRNFNFAEFIH